MSFLSSIVPLLKTALKAFIASDAGKALLVLLLDYLCTLFANVKQRLTSKTQGQKQNAYIDDDELFE